MARLVWQHWRQSASTMLTIGTVALLLAVSGAVIVALPVAPETRLACYFYMVMVPATLLGSCLFLGDQRGWSFRFLVEHGVGRTRCG